MAIVLKGATLIDGTANPVVEDAVLIIENDIITAAGNIKQISIPDEAELIDVSGKTIIPGLIDCHIHMDLHGFANTYEENLLEDKLRTIRAAKEMENTLKRGITTVRNVGSVNGIDFAVKEAVNSTYCQGPRILTSGKIISMTAEGNDYFAGLYREADGPDEVRKAAREQLKAGADVLKIMTTGAVMNPGGIPGAAQFNMDEIRAVVEEGAKLGVKVAAHAHGSEGIKNSILSGVKTIEHCTFMNDEIIELLIKHNVYMVPTYVVDYLMLQAGEKGGIPSFMLDKINSIHDDFVLAFKKAVEAGVKIAFGTDAGTNYNYHGNNALELVLYVKDGFMSPIQAIHSATEVAAEALGIEDKIGTLKVGKSADLLVINGSLQNNLEPLLDSVEMVFKDGKLVK